MHVPGGLDCRNCHGGAARYAMPPEELRRYQARPVPEPGAATAPAGALQFDHGREFRGKPTHRQIPELCGGCHSDVEKMNPYGLPTDQLAQYRLSGHGRALFQSGNERVAVCSSCHTAHKILSPKDPTSSTYPKNVPGTCGSCHSRPDIMMGTHLNISVVEQYGQSVHGEGLLERGDLGMPTCATCHGNHSAIPPGFRDIGHVCGRCHQQEEARGKESFHAKFPLFPLCVGCHSSDPRNHRIVRVAARPDDIKKASQRALEHVPGATLESPALAEAYAAQRTPPFLGVVCQHCHNASREIGHRVFFIELDKQANQMGSEILDLLRHAELSYGLTALRVDRLARGVLLVPDEAMQVDEMRTRLLELNTLQHTLDLPKIRAAVADLDGLGRAVNNSLDAKEWGLRWRYYGLIFMWAFIVIFVSVLWAKYKQLKHEWVKPLPGVNV